MTGVYYSFDIPAALHQQLKDYMSGGTDDVSDDGSGSNYAVMFNLLYSVYSIPNIILPFFGGAIVDHLGADRSAVIFSILTLLGQIIFAAGTSIRSWKVMLLGRTVYGLGGESISVATSAINSKWFAGKELALAFGINIAVSRLGSVFNNLISPSLANSHSTPVSIWVGVGLNTLSVLCAVIIYYLTKKGEKECQQYDHDLIQDDSTSAELTVALLEDDGLALQEESTIETSSSHINSDQENDSNEEDASGISPFASDQEQLSSTTETSLTEGNRQQSPNLIQVFSQVTKFGTMFWLLSASCIVVYGCVLPFNNIASGLLLERNYFTDPPSDCFLQYPNQCTGGYLAPSDGNPSIDQSGTSCSYHAYKRPILPTSLHLQANASNAEWDKESYDYDYLSESDVDCGDPFWADACTADFCAAQRRATELSGRVMSIPYILSATLSPFCGHLVDRVGKRAFIASMASVALVAVHLALALLNCTPVYPLLGQGLAYVGYAAVIWPSVPLTVSEEWIGTAFGAITAVQNIGLALFPMIIAMIYNYSDERYIPNVEFFFVACAAVGTILGIMLNVFDRRNGGALNKKTQ
jgi:MFS family permease